VLIFIAAIGACRASPTAPTPAAAAQSEETEGGDATATPAAEADAAPGEDAKTLAPLGSAEWMESLDLGDGKRASLTVPLGATEPRPIWIAAHGAGDRPEWACGGWRLATDTYPFIVCPRGRPLGANAFVWGSPKDIVQATRAAVEIVRARFGAYVAEGPLVYAGFSQGANLASAAILDPSMPAIDRVIFAEGGYGTTADRGVARRLRDHGITRAWLVCGQVDCRTSAAEATQVLARAGIDVSTGGDVRSGHNLNMAMQKAIARDLGWLVRDDPRWDAWRRSRADASTP
jgi:predicted esterase